MLDYLFDAMNEISDEHITEAVNFKAKAKKINFKKLIPMAACFVFVVVALLVGAGFFDDKPPVTEPTQMGTPTNAPTQAIQNSTTFAPTQAPVREWEELTYGERFGDITVDDVKYIYAFDKVDEKKIGESIATLNLEVEYLLNDWHRATAEVYAIKFISTEWLVAVRFAEDEDGEYYIYVCPGYAPETLGDLLDDIDINNNVNFIGSTAIYHKEYANGDYTEAGYKIDPQGHKMLSGLLWQNRDVLRCKKDYHDNLFVASYPETITVRFDLVGEKGTTVYIEAFDNKTHLYILYGTEQFCFELSESVFREYNNFLVGEAELEFLRQGCPTAPTVVPTTSLTTTQPHTGDNSDEVKKVIYSSEFLIDIIEGFHIRKEDYGISGDVTINQFAYFEQEGKEDIIYSIGAATNQQLVDFMCQHSDSKAENKKCEADTVLSFRLNIDGYMGRITLGCDGYLYFSCDNTVKAFYVGEDAYRTFKENLIAAVWTTDAPVTLG